MNRYLLWIIPCLFALSGMGQKANYKLAERFTERSLKALVGTLQVSPTFINHGDKFWYRYTTTEGCRYYIVDPRKKSHREMFDREYMAGEISKATGDVLNPKDLKLFFKFFEGNDDVCFIEWGNKAFKYDLKSRKVACLDSMPKEPRKVSASMPKKKTYVGTYSPDSTYVVYVKEHDLYLLSVADSVETRLTTDGAKECSFAVHDKGKNPAKGNVTWFAGGKSFIAERTDYRNYKPQKFAVVNSLGKRPTLNEYEFAVPGDDFGSQPEVFFFRVDEKKPVKVATEKWNSQKYQLYLPVKYATVTKHVFFTRKKRTCEEMEFCKIDPETGEVKVLIHEVSRPYLSDDYFHVSFLREGNDIIWWSDRTGYGHLYHYDSDGRLLNAITAGNWTTSRVLKTDTVRREVYFEAYGQVEGGNPYCARVNKASIDREKVVVLTPEEGMHEVYISDTYQYLVDNYSRPDLEPRSVVRDNNGKLICELASPDLSRLYATGWKMPEPIKVKAADGVTDLYGYMWKPVDFDSTKSYPIISYVYPGPQADAVPRRFNLTGYFNMPLAQVGFVVVTFGHRGGVPFRERWYHTFGYGNLRDYALADDKYGIEQLADTYSFIDRDRVGIFGHSGGGFMSAAAILTYPDFYKVAVSASGNHDNTIYNKWWGETFHGIKEVTAKETKREKNMKTGKDSSTVTEKMKFEFKVPTTIELAKNLKGHLMLVTGDVDRNVHPAHTLRLANALLLAGKNFDLVVLPGQEHAYNGTHLDFFERKMWFHFAKYLLGDYSCEEFIELDDYLRK